MVIQPGDRLLVAYRRLFDGDQPRVFAGEVERAADGLVRLTGHGWARDASGSGWSRAADPRTLILPLDSPATFVFALPPSTDIAALTIETNSAGVIAAAGPGLRLELPELRLSVSGRWS